MITDEAESHALGVLVHRKGGTTLPSMPTFPTRHTERIHGKQRLAAAFRILALHGMSYGVGGHITYRDPVLIDHFWVNPLGVDFSRICVSDLVLVRDDGTIVEGRHSIINGAGYAIHSSIHKARADVNAAAHSHSIYGTSFSTLGRKMPPISQEACSFYGDHELYAEYGGAAVGTEGECIATALARAKAVICQSHGVFTVGHTVDEAVFWFMRMERACQQFLLASAAGKPLEIDHETATLTQKQIGKPDLGHFGLSPMMTRILAEQPDLLE